jgi:hypothetical protein
MTCTPPAPKATFLNLLRVKLSKIARAERRYIDRAEEHVRAYAEGLADANILTDDERDEFYELAKQAAEDAVRAYKAAERGADVATTTATVHDSERYTAGLAYVANGGLDADGHEDETKAPYYFGHSAIQAFEAGAVWQAKRSAEVK